MMPFSDSRMIRWPGQVNASFSRPNCLSQPPSPEGEGLKDIDSG